MSDFSENQLQLFLNLLSKHYQCLNIVIVSGMSSFYKMIRCPMNAVILCQSMIYEDFDVSYLGYFGENKG